MYLCRPQDMTYMVGHLEDNEAKKKPQILPQPRHEI